MIQGSCLCGTTRWRVDGPVADMSHCHCSMCRKAHGAAFGTYMTAAAGDFGWVEGEGEVVRYTSSPGFVRGFCGHCGSVTPVVTATEVYLPAGCLDDDPGVRPSEHIFVASRAPWYEIVDELEQHQAYEPGVDLPVIERVAAGADAPGVLHGSCLCAAVAFEVTEPLKAVHNCHCSRCRKARAAAHATNGFTPAEAVRFLRGEDHLVSYKPPEARFFTHVFCDTCGSGLPRIDLERGIAVIPLGSLDDDPEHPADDHIFVGSKAAWFDIVDDLPRFEEGLKG
jgi:hypothetical protein